MSAVATETAVHVDTSGAIWRAGNGACAGCGMSLGLQWLDRAFRDVKPTMIVPASCAIVTPGSYPSSSYGVPTIGTTFGSASAVASGVTRVRQLNGEDCPTVCWAGDGGTYDIGMASLSGAAERNEDLIYICYDNEIYGNTGGQRSSATLPGARTSTTSGGKHEPKKDMVSIVAAHGVPYVATLSLAHPEDFSTKLEKARRCHGFRFLLMLSPCPAGWKSEPARTVDLVRAAVGCGIFPLIEIFDGRRYRINARPDGTPIERFVDGQRRFREDSAATCELRSMISEKWAHIEALAAAMPARQDE